MSDERKSGYFHLAVLTIGHLLVDFYFGLFMPLAIVLAQRLNEPLWRITALMGICGVVVNVVQPLAGWLAPKFGKPVLLAFSPLLALFLALIGLADTFAQLAAVALVAHVGIGVFHPEALMAAQEVSGSREHVGVPIFLSGGFFGVSVGSVVATQWCMRTGLDKFWLLCLPGAALTLLVLGCGLHRLDLHRPEPPETGEGTEPQVSFFELLLLGVLLTTPTAILTNFLVPRLEEAFGRNTALEYGGYALALVGIASSLGSYLLGWLSRRVDTYLLAAVTQLGCAGCCLLVAGAKTPGAALMLAAVAGALMSVFPVIATLARRARGLTRGLRAGLIVGGSWGCASLALVGLSAWLPLGLSLSGALRVGAAVAVAAALLAAALYAKKRGSKNRQIQPDHG